ncbi:MAG: hypothetical protein PHG85_00325 [Candidatus Altiarchaeota archaeon]|nr:hypothetical protein [Candidatus Altiarchaeota archaeon]
MTETGKKEPGFIQGLWDGLMKHKTVNFIIMVIIILIIWDIMQKPHYSGVMITASGFAKIKPQLYATSLRADGNFTGVFTDGAGARITVMTATATLDNGDTCTLTAIPTQASAGDNFILSGSSCDAGGDKGDMYMMTISIPYTIVIGNITSTHNDTGRINGPLM